MSRLHIIMLPRGSCFTGRGFRVDGSSLVLVPGAVPVELPPSTTSYRFSAAQLQSAYYGLQHLLVGRNSDVGQNTLLTVPADAGVLHATGQLATVDPDAMLRFVLAYCLALEGVRCTALLRKLVAADLNLFEFIHCNRLEPWPVARYAELLGLPVRKFSPLFKEKFGVSAKHWLLMQRLEHAKLLLETTSKKVIDVAFESGFGNQAHFSEIFHRHFRMSPTAMRRRSLSVVLSSH